MWRCIIISLLVLTLNSAWAEGFDGAGGFSVALYKPDFAPINESLQSLGMPKFDQPMVIYGGQGFAYVSRRVAIGGAGFGGMASVSDLENGYARTARFTIGWGGVMFEYLLLELNRVDFIAGGLVGWGGVSLHLQKTHSPLDWDEIWNNYQALSDSSENVSTDFTHSFFVFQPRVGVRVYLTNWMALGACIEVPLSKLSSGGWKLNEADVYNAPDMDLIAPFYHFSILFGG
jgi:hypothetical protein